jgi:N-acetylmuramoyl-L-alanine amidase
LDPGHQQKANYETEPISPGSTIMKAKVSSGTSGVVTHRAEYIVNLEISLKLRQFLEAKGCIVYMTRSTNNVNISNIERALFAVAKNPDVFIRIHCNGSSDSSANGVKVFVADTGIYKAKMPTWGRLLATCQSATTGAKNLGVNAGSTYTGLNWATDIPSFLLEMGFMSNAAEDRLLSTPDYQSRICQGVADFIQQMPKR